MEGRKKRMWHKLVSFLAIMLFITFAGGMHTSASASFEIQIDGVSVGFDDAEPFINEDNRTMVPLRFVSENLGADVAWLSDTQSVEIRQGETMISLRIGERFLMKNGTQHEMDTEMVFLPEYGRTFVPIRFISEYLGSSVDFERTADGGYLIALATPEDEDVSEPEPVDEEIPEEDPFRPDDEPAEPEEPTEPTEPTQPSEPTEETDGQDQMPEGEIGRLDHLLPGTSEEDVRSLLGEPDRIEHHFLGYEWLVYHEPIDEYVQVAVEDGFVREVYSLSEHFGYADVTIGETTYAELTSLYPLQEEIVIEGERVTYRLNGYSDSLETYLSDSGDYLVQFFLDHHEDDNLTGIRIMDEETALKLNPSGMGWSSFPDAVFLHERPELTEEEQDSVNRSNERIMFDLINVNRDRFGLNTLDFRPDISEVAYHHSVDMRENGFFAHESPFTGSPADRMEAAGLTRGVGENLAFGQRDAIDANAALMNSLGHRENILQSGYQEVGIGVYHFHFTQKFVR